MNISDYNIIWDEQSKNASEGMPVGGFDTGLNLWTEKGEIIFYIDRSGSFDENNQMLKLGRIRLTIIPNTLASKELIFSQKMKIKEGYVEITGEATMYPKVHIKVWVEVDRPIIHVDIISEGDTTLIASYENWRFKEREIPKERRLSALSTAAYMGKVTTEADNIEINEDSITFYHRNKNELLFFDKLIEQQGLKNYKDKLWNPQKNLTFGGKVKGDNMSFEGTYDGVYEKIPYLGYTLKSNIPSENHNLSIYLNSAQCESLSDWKDKLEELIIEGDKDKKISASKAILWWEKYWEQSYIYIDKEKNSSKPWQVGRNYNLFRYMLGCNAYGTYPTKFNGGLFTSDPSVMVSRLYEGETPDYRQWGGGSFTAQNQRLVYWPMLKSGDYQMMYPQFDYYLRGLPAAQLRTKVYWGHEGASFTEQLENFGLPTGLTWGWLGSDNPLYCRTEYSDPTEQLCPWVRYLYINQLEFSYMILKFYKYSNLDISKYMPFIESSIRFFDEHYQYRHLLNTGRKLDKEGKLVLFPSTAGETYKDATNPTDLIAALDATVSAVLELPNRYIDDKKAEYYKGLLKRIPPITLREMNGRQTIAPAKHFTEIINSEIPQLYCVFPYEQYMVGKDNLQLAIDTWNYGVETKAQKDFISWHQDNIFCAKLGLTDEAKEYAILKLQDGPRRFPAFWGPGHDWVPDMNQGGSGMIGLQAMLLEANGDSILLFPAWPIEWDVDFKLYAPGNTIVECSYKDGVVRKLEIWPEARRKDIINYLDK